MAKQTYENSRRFYNDHVAPMIRERFPDYENRIAAGISGEGSDCFGYDDLISRDHDYGTGVCLWISDDDMREYGALLSDAYNDLTESLSLTLSDRLRERRGVMTIHDFYSNILGIDCNTDECKISDGDWKSLDYSCLATAVNGEIFKDDKGDFSAFRNLLLAYYPDHIWRIRIAQELHRYSAALQVNYARCMTRGDIVAAKLCQSQGISAAMELFFLLKREYPPYYKWTYRRLTELDSDGIFSGLIQKLAGACCDDSVWKGKPYRPNILNTSDTIVVTAERIAGVIVSFLRAYGWTESLDPYLESYVNVII
ncbi:MAG: DUF4037 domain-containing protein [Lachnospiraceae bacterium]|nr:DUF4037 domain-containing protein [Lachnospiraceae bacterium]